YLGVVPYRFGPRAPTSAKRTERLIYSSIEGGAHRRGAARGRRQRQAEKPELRRREYLAASGVVERPGGDEELCSVDVRPRGSRPGRRFAYGHLWHPGLGDGFCRGRAQ